MILFTFCLCSAETFRQNLSEIRNENVYFFFDFVLSLLLTLLNPELDPYRPLNYLGWVFIYLFASKFIYLVGFILIWRCILDNIWLIRRHPHYAGGKPDFARRKPMAISRFVVDLSTYDRRDSWTWTAGESPLGSFHCALWCEKKTDRARVKPTIIWKSLVEFPAFAHIN